MNTNVKKLFSIVLALIMLFAVACMVASCGGTHKNNSSTDSDINTSSKED